MVIQKEVGRKRIENPIGRLASEKRRALSEMKQVTKTRMGNG